jgi:hypothetical protein
VLKLDDAGQLLFVGVRPALYILEGKMKEKEAYFIGVVVDFEIFIVYLLVVLGRVFAVVECSCGDGAGIVTHGVLKVGDVGGRMGYVLGKPTVEVAEAHQTDLAHAACVTRLLMIVRVD